MTPINMAVLRGIAGDIESAVQLIAACTEDMLGVLEALEAQDAPEATAYPLRRYLVVWRDDNGVIQSEVETVRDPSRVTDEEWVARAAGAEGYTIPEVEGLLGSGYDLYLVIPFPDTFYA